MSFAITLNPHCANACETRVVPEKPSNTVRGSTLAASSSMCGKSFSFEPAYLIPSVRGVVGDIRKIFTQRRNGATENRSPHTALRRCAFAGEISYCYRTLRQYPHKHNGTSKRATH